MRRFINRVKNRLLKKARNSYMSMIVTTVIPEGIVMAADSAAFTFKMMDIINFRKGNIPEAMQNTFSGT